MPSDPDPQSFRSDLATPVRHPVGLAVQVDSLRDRLDRRPERGRKAQERRDEVAVVGRSVLVEQLRRRPLAMVLVILGPRLLLGLKCLPRDLQQFL